MCLRRDLSQTKSKSDLKAMKKALEEKPEFGSDLHSKDMGFAQN